MIAPWFSLHCYIDIPASLPTFWIRQNTRTDMNLLSQYRFDPKVDLLTQPIYGCQFISRSQCTIIHYIHYLAIMPSFFIFIVTPIYVGWGEKHIWGEEQRTAIDKPCVILSNDLVEIFCVIGQGPLPLNEPLQTPSGVAVPNSVVPLQLRVTPD